MSTVYAAEIASAGVDIGAAGQSVTFTRTTQTYVAATDSTVPVVTTSTGNAMRVRPRFTDITRFLEPGLSLVDPVTLIVAASGMAFDPLPGDSFVWSVYTYSVRSVDITGPDGTTIISRIIGSR